MTITNVNEIQPGDKLKVTALDDSGDVIATNYIWAVRFDEDETGEANDVLFTYHPFDYSAPQVPIQSVLDDARLALDIEVPVADALPTEPGEYEDRARYFATKNIEGTFLEELLRENGEWLSDKPWILHENGEWEAPSGERRDSSENWKLAAEGFEFIPWAQRDEVLGAEYEAEKAKQKDEGFDLSF